MDKNLLVEQLSKIIEEEIEVTVRAAQSAKEAATHEELVAENKYDTKGLEASYLAGAQARRSQELRSLLSELSILKIRNFEEDSPLSLSALVELTDDNSKLSYYFLVPSQGGYKLEQKGVTIQCITPNAPLGKSLMGKVVGDEIELSLKNEKIFFEITNSW